MKFPLPPGLLLYTAVGLSGLCVTVMGAGAQASHWMHGGLGVGLVLGVGLFLVIVKTTVLLCSLQTRKTLRSLTQGDREGEAAAHIVLHAVALYEAAAFRITSSGQLYGLALAARLASADPAQPSNRSHRQSGVAHERTDAGAVSGTQAPTPEWGSRRRRWENA
ncbi:hypothetical protein ABT275_41160 [Streptomyces sp. NPDC001185]|uniref:hypothetical protein n=1 Tax=Streptomyces sp. NPDC001185 TaxID=3154380 RepID=UPI00332B0D85